MQRNIHAIVDLQPRGLHMKASELSAFQASHITPLTLSIKIQCKECGKYMEKQTNIRDITRCRCARREHIQSAALGGHGESGKK